MAENTIKDVKLKIGTETQFQEKLKDLPINTLVGTTDPIQEGELDTSIINKLDKAENALPKPTNDTTGSAGQVLKKTADGSEWGDVPSGGGEAVVPSGATASATSGTFTSAEWTKLQADKNNYIWFNNEIYRLADMGHEGTEGIWSYVHTGWDGTAMRDKSINVTVSTGAWTLVQGEASGGKLYKHNIQFDIVNGTVNDTVNDVSATVYMIAINSSSTPNTIDDPLETLKGFVTGRIQVTAGNSTTLNMLIFVGSDMIAYIDGLTNSQSLLTIGAYLNLTDTVIEL